MRAQPTALPRTPLVSISARALRIRDERASDYLAREALLDEGFGRDRRLKTSERLREGRLPAHRLALIAEHNGQRVGTVRLWHVDAGGVPALLLGPLAVKASHQGLGIGSALMREALARAKALGHGAVLLVGDAPYYARFGFAADGTRQLTMPGPVAAERFLAVTFAAGALARACGPVVATGRRAAREPLRGQTLQAA